MKFILSSSMLSSRLQTIGRVIVSKNSLTILDSFLFDIHEGKLTITASDNETTLTTWMEVVETESDIRFAVNAKTIQDAIKEIPEQPLAFYVNETNLEITVQYQNGEYHFMGQVADEYPLPAELEEAGNMTIASSKLLSGIGRALFATADDTLRPVMNGILFNIESQTITLVASDGHKMSCSSFYNITASQDGRLILPKKPATILKAVLGKEDGDITIRYGERGACIISEFYQLNCRLVEGRYPNYASVIPHDNPNCVVINKIALQSALRRVLIFSNATSALIKLRLEMGRAVISSQDIDFSKSAEESLLCDYTGYPMSIGFKGTFLMELLNNIDSEEIIIKLADASRAGIIVPLQQNDNEHQLMLLMPMMLND